MVVLRVANGNMYPLIESLATKVMFTDKQGKQGETGLVTVNVTALDDFLLHDCVAIQVHEIKRVEVPVLDDKGIPARERGYAGEELEDMEMVDKDVPGDIIEIAIPEGNAPLVAKKKATPRPTVYGKNDPYAPGALAEKITRKATVDATLLKDFIAAIYMDLAGDTIVEWNDAGMDWYVRTSDNTMLVHEHLAVGPGMKEPANKIRWAFRTDDLVKIFRRLPKTDIRVGWHENIVTFKVKRESGAVQRTIKVKTIDASAPNITDEVGSYTDIAKVRERVTTLTVVVNPIELRDAIGKLAGFKEEKKADEPGDVNEAKKKSNGAEVLSISVDDKDIVIALHGDVKKSARVPFISKQGTIGKPVVLSTRLLWCAVGPVKYGNATLFLNSGKPVSVGYMKGTNTLDVYIAPRVEDDEPENAARHGKHHHAPGSLYEISGSQHVLPGLYRESESGDLVPARAVAPGKHVTKLKGTAADKKLARQRAATKKGSTDKPSRRERLVLWLPRAWDRAWKERRPGRPIPDMPDDWQDHVDMTLTADENLGNIMRVMKGNTARRGEHMIGRTNNIGKNTFDKTISKMKEKGKLT